MDRTSKNGLDLIGIAGSKLKNVWGKGFLGSLLYVTPIVLLLFIPYVGWALSIAVFGWLTAGYVSFMKKLLNNENPSYKLIFTTVNEFAQATLMGIILCTGIILGLVVLIVPGIIVVAYYSMSFFVLDEESITGVSDALNISSRKMEGNKTAMFAYKVVYYLLYTLIVLASVVAFICISKLYPTQQALAVCLGIVNVLVFVVLVAVVTVYFYASNVVFYNEIVREKAVEYEVKKPVEGTDLKELNIVSADAKIEEKNNEPQPSEPVKEEVKKPATKKPVAKKTTSTKTSTTKTNSTKKTTNK